MPVDFTDFVISRTPALLRFAYLLSGDAHLAEDLTQEALVRVHRRWAAIERVEGPEPYVRKAILHQYLSWRRLRASTEVPRATLPDGPDPQRVSEWVVEHDEMWSMLATLPRMQRAVLVLRYYEDLADAEVAALLGCSPATVRVHAFKALKRLRLALVPVAASEVGHG